VREKYEQEFARFNRDIAEHRVTVLRDDGLYRHLRCRRGDSYTYGFDIITWPGYLCYSGDMGCFVFTRIPDMFGFFRGRREAMVDRGYLAEKCVAGDKSDGVREYSPELFRAAVQSDVESFAEDMPEDQRASLLESVRDEVLPYADDGIQRAVAAAMDFEWGKRSVFTDFWEHRLEDYTPRFWWCCYAVPWAIEQYDAITRESPQSVAAVDPQVGITTG
jgi:hypothetical protein